MGNQELHELAYMQWFQKKSHQNLNQMVIVELTDKFDVIGVEKIYCPIHLIPKFEIIKDLKTTASN